MSHANCKIKILTVDETIITLRLKIALVLSTQNYANKLRILFHENCKKEASLETFFTKRLSINYVTLKQRGRAIGATISLHFPTKA